MRVSEFMDKWAPASGPERTQFALDFQAMLSFFFGSEHIGSGAIADSEAAFYQARSRFARVPLVEVCLPEFPKDRCRVCGWPLAASAAEGCVPGNCSMRPAPAVRADFGYRPAL